MLRGDTGGEESPTCVARDTTLHCRLEEEEEEEEKEENVVERGGVLAQLLKRLGMNGPGR